MAILTEKGREYQEAVTTLNSEREANALLTDEIEALRVERDALQKALAWAMAQYGMSYTRRIKGQNETYCDRVDNIRALLKGE